MVHTVFAADLAPKMTFILNFGVDFFFQESCLLEELGIFERHWQIPRQKLLPVVRLFLGRVPWRRGKQGGLCF